MALTPVTTSEADPLTRVRLDVSYDGTDFSGWAAQPDQRTVQGVLQDALATVLRLPAVHLTVAGRTDAGVHATGQVAHADLPEPVWLAHRDRLAGRLSRLLPPDVVVRDVVDMPAAFDARFAALWRRYEYRIDDRPTGPDPLRRRQVLGSQRPLDVAAMAAAATRLVGLHDFAAFCRRREGATTVREIQQFVVTREPTEISCVVQADAFCHSMVRSLVGALLAVGEGRRPPEWPAALIERAHRADEVGVAPAHGLTLLAVGYPPPSEWAVRTGRTRARRSD
jgi:tRNA pseudouridine38-40 synthase